MPFETPNIPWGVLTQIATVLAALVPLTVLLFQLQAAARARMRETAKEVRRELLGFSHEVEIWNKELDNTSLMFVAAVRSTGELNQRELRPALDGTDPSITAAVSLGWNESRSPSRLDAADHGLRRSSHRLTGKLALLHEATPILTNIRWQRYSQLTVLRGVEAWTVSRLPLAEPDGDKGHLEAFLIDYLASTDKELRASRHGIRIFIATAIAQAAALPDRDLVQLSQGPTPLVSTYLDAMREFVRQLRGATGISVDNLVDLKVKLAKAEEALRETGLVSSE